MPRLSWNEVRDRAIKFSRRWKETDSERSEKQTFWNKFFDVFGIRGASLASFEENVKSGQLLRYFIEMLIKRHCIFPYY